jgi:hypothetical protein
MQLENNKDSKTPPVNLQLNINLRSILGLSDTTTTEELAKEINSSKANKKKVCDKILEEAVNKACEDKKITLVEKEDFIKQGAIDFMGTIEKLNNIQPNSV